MLMFYSAFIVSINYKCSKSTLNVDTNVYDHVYDDRKIF